jgi:hypothetical protein
MIENEQALKYLDERFRRAQGGVIVTVPGEAPHVQRFIESTGALAQIITSAPLRQMQMNDLPSLVQLCHRIAQGDTLDDLAGGEPGKILPKRCAVAVSESQVILYLNVDDLRECVIVPLVETDAYSFFSDLGEAQYRLSQEELLEALRYRLIDTLPDAQRKTYIKQLEKVVWQTNITNDNTRTRGSDSMGKAINEKIVEQSDVGLPPDALTFTVNRWVNVHPSIQDLSIICAFDMDTQMKRFILRPHGPAWEVYHQRGVEQVIASLQDSLKDTGIPVYAGKLK